MAQGDDAIMRPGLRMIATARLFLRPSSIAIFFVMGMIGGCTEPRDAPSVKSDDLTLKVPAIKEDVQRRTDKDVPLMVGDLDDDDPAVRFYAIEGLRRLTGKDFGYRYYDDEDERKPALDRWNTWLKSHDGK
jgi:hypothetical protein